MGLTTSHGEEGKIPIRFTFGRGEARQTMRLRQRNSLSAYTCGKFGIRQMIKSRYSTKSHLQKRSPNVGHPGAACAFHYKKVPEPEPLRQVRRSPAGFKVHKTSVYLLSLSM